MFTIVPNLKAQAYHVEQVSNAADINAANNGSIHQWVKMGTEFAVIPVDTHEFTIWHNFVKKKRNCEITHKVKTVVWYCELHHHTKSETLLEETIHSKQHN